ncbi:MAG: glycosyltransferase family 4 protein [Methylocella sp.]
MGLRVGVVLGNHEPGAGGAWTYSAMLTAALKIAQFSHTFLVLDGILADHELKQPVADYRPPLFWRRLFRTTANKAIAPARKSIGLARYDTTDMTPQNDENINCLEAIARSERINLVWLMEPWSEPLTVPYIATVWDLEHRKQPYFPEVSTTGWTWSARENVYNALLPRASMIITGTQTGKEEVVRYYHVNPANVMIIPLPAPAGAWMGQPLDAAGIKEKYRLNGDFLLYPAQFWPHKNHVNLLRALRLLRNRTDLDLSLVLTGSDKGNRDYVMQHVVELGLGDRVFVPGFVPREDLDALYQASTALVFPSYFGPDNFPPLEAFALNCPVIAANVPGAREQMGEAALLFDPSDPSDIAAKIEFLCREPGLRPQLIRDGNEIAKRRTAHAYIATLCSFLDRFEAIRRCWGVTYDHSCSAGRYGDERLG